MFKNLIRGVGVGAGILSMLVFNGTPQAAVQSSHYTQEGGEVHYNWGMGGPSGLKDNFTATFNQTKTLSKGDYFVQSWADDGVRVEADGKRIIDRLGSSNGSIDRALWLGVPDGQHNIKTDYVEYLNNASIFSDVAKLDSWVAYYYPNDGLRGMPTRGKVINPTGTLKKLYENNGYGSPASGIPNDHFSARYNSAKRLPAGNYVLRTKTDDGIKIYVDGKLVLDRWKQGAYKEQAAIIPISDRAVSNPNEKDIHWVEIYYREDTSSSYIDFSLEPYSSSFGDNWMAEYFPNKNLQGTPIVVGGKNSYNKISNLNFNWDRNAPNPYIPADNFSARFTRTVSLNDGTYLFKSLSDDGVRVWVDGQKVIDGWRDGVSARTAIVPLKTGTHTIKVEYYEYAGPARISLSYTPFSNINISGGTVHYNWGESGPTGLKDYFTAAFNQSKVFNSGNYFIQTLADDGVTLDIDGKRLIDRWTPATGRVDQALWLNAAAGSHTVKTNYMEYVKGAGIYSDIVPFDSWLAYYYPNPTMSGFPVSAKVIPPTGFGLKEDNALGSPSSGVPSDHFTARYTTAKKIPAGKYILRTKADDGIRVYIDGKLVLDRWAKGAYNEEAMEIPISDRVVSQANEKDVHWIEVQYRDDTWSSYVNLFLEPYETSVSSDSWLGEIYSNKDFQGQAVIIGGSNSVNKITDLNFNWGTGSPNSSIPADNFSARFKKKPYFDAGTYVFQTNSDDNAKVWVDGQKIIDSGGLNKNDIYLSSGYHDIVVEYQEYTSTAYLQLKYQKISSNRIFYQFNGDVHYNWGAKSPGSNIPADNFQALFEQTKYFAAGDYFIQTHADDGVKVQADGNELINRWTAANGTFDRALWLGVTAGSHTVNTSYYDSQNDAGIFSDVVPFGNWLAYYYTNKDLKGLPTAAKIINPGTDPYLLKEDNQLGSPSSLIPADNFSARYSTAKRLKAGEYILRTKADDGLRVYIDGELVVDRWTTGAYSDNTISFNVSDRNTANSSEKDIHWIEVQYREDTSTSNLEFEFKPLPLTAQVVTAIKLPVYRSYDELSNYTLHLTYYNSSYTRYMELSYGDIVYKLEENNYAVKIQTLDGKIGWVHKAYLDSSITVDRWLVKDGRTFRAGPGTSYQDLGFIDKGSKVIVLDYKKTSDSSYTEWYQIQTESGQKGWIWGALNYDQSGFNLIDFDFDKQGKVTNQISIFTPLNTLSSVTADQINKFVDYKTGGQQTAMTGMGAYFLEAQAKSGLNAVYLLSHAGLETGWGKSLIVKTKYNFYGIGAIDTNPGEGAYTYDTPQGGIVAGAIWISKNYVVRDQYYTNSYPQMTLDNMRYNNGYHQYSTDEAWASKISQNAAEFYNYIN